MKLVSAIRNLSFSSQLAIFSIAFTVLIGITISWLIIYESKQALKTSALLKAEAAAKAQSRLLNDEFSNFERNTNFFLESGLVYTLVDADGNVNKMYGNTAALLKSYSERYLQNYKVEKISFFKKNQEVLYVENSHGILASPPKLDFEDVLYDHPYRENKDIYVNAYFRLNAEDNKDFYAGFKLNLSPYLKSLKDSLLLGKHGETVLAYKPTDSTMLYVGNLAHNNLMDKDAQVDLESDIAKPYFNAFNQKYGTEQIVNYAGNNMIASWTLISKLDWAMVSQLDEDEIYEPIDELRNKVFLIAGFLVALAAVLAILIARNMVKPIISLKDIIERLSQGDRVNYRLKNYNNNEIGQMIGASLELAEYMNNIINFSTNISAKEFEKNKNIDINRGEIGNALETMEQNLIRVEQEDKIKRWSNEGIAKFSTLIRDFSRSPKELGNSLISELVQYIDCNLGGMFILNEEHDKLDQWAFYAFNRQKFSSRSLKKGDGLLWQAITEKRSIYMTAVPENYVRIASGLGDTIPRAILLVPLVINEEVFGVIELASLEPLEQYKLDFIDNVSESIAGAIAGLRVTQRTEELLRVSQLKTQELTTQEEELRQNMEEMKATQEEMVRIQAEIETKEAMLVSLINYSDDTYFCLDKEYNILVANDALKDRYKKSGVEIKIGHNVFNYLPEDQHEAWKARYNRILEGESFTEDLEREVAGEILYVQASYDPVINDYGKVVGATVRSKDVTDVVKLKMRLKVLEHKLREQG